MLVHRFDVAALGHAERTPQGFLRIPGYLTRVGVLEYRRADGQVVRELRPRDEVFRAQSLATLSAAPVTDLHPTEMVTPDNVRALQIGHVSDEVKADGRHVSAYVTIQDAKAIAAVERGDRRELSCGYQCRIDLTPGVYEGEPYDQVQRSIVYNHLAIGPKNWGRAGRDVALRVDAKDGDAAADGGVFRLDQADALSVATTAPPDDGDPMDLVTIRVDGVDAQMTKQAEQLVSKALETRDGAFAEVLARAEKAEARAEKAEGRADTLETEAKKTKAELVQAQDPVRLDERIAERETLREQARRVLPAEHTFEGQTNRQIHEAVILHRDSSLVLTELTDDLVKARFDGVMLGLGPTEPTSNLDQARRATTPAPAKRPAARADAAEPKLADWQKPLSYTKARTKTF